MRSKREALRAAIENYGNLRALIVRMQATALDLFAHPDATDEQRLDAAKRLGEVAANARRTRAHLLEANAKYGDWVTTSKLGRLK